ncbi:hypothetical protein M9435_006193 [Picochlorum sp. BPE23]|nr:hypothetical protein M9435_006193 [Picochlorum sp. BPE23]
MWMGQNQEEQRARVAAKEAFVQGLTGSGVTEIVVMTTLPTVLSIIYMAIESIVVRCGCSIRDWRVAIVLGMMEYGVMIVPEIMGMTEAYDAYAMLVVASVVAFVLIGLGVGKKRDAEQSQEPHQHGDMRPPPYTVALEEGGIKDAVSMHRAQVMLMTCLAILGVDFRAFPRRFAKTETYGTSLMDAGVGSIVLCSSFVQGVNQMKSPRYTAKRLKDSWSSLLRVVVLVLLGIGKPVVTSLMGYQVHVGEYGRHWNFFLTLAVLRAVIMNVPRSTSPLALGVTVAGAHQYGLSRFGFGLGELVNSDARGTSLLQQNKEGIISLPGYIALHFLGLWCAKVFVWMASLRVRRHINALLLLFVGFLWTTYWALAMYVEPVSRRSCNASFIAWMLAINVQAMLLNSVCLRYMRSHTDMGSRTVSKRSNASPYLPPLLNAVNRGMLYIFLAANVMTGGINSFVDTLSIGDIQARRILAIYMAVMYVFSRTLF